MEAYLIITIFRWMPELNDMLSMMKNTIDNRLKPKSRPASVTGNHLLRQG